MKKLLTKVCFLSALLALFFCVSAAAASSDVVEYEVEGGVIEFNTVTRLVTDADHSVTAANIPAKIEGIPVMGVDNAFNGCTKLVSVTLPEGITTIGNNSFYDCKKLTGITLPSTLKSIGKSAFLGCDALESVTIPYGVIDISNYAFADCVSLARVNLPGSVKTIGDCAFRGCSALESIALPAGLGTVGNSAFKDCTALTSISFPDSVASIDQYALQNCTALKTVTLPAALTTIKVGTLIDCTSLERVNIPAGVTEIQSSAFRRCASLKTISIPSSVTEIEGSVFEDCASLKNVTLSSGLTSIGSSAFKNCAAITNLTLPNTLTSIGSYAFSGCKGLTAIVIPDSASKSLRYNAFESCTSLTSARLPEGLSLIPNKLFYGCGELKNVHIPKSVTYINTGAFQYCYSLTDVYYGGTEAGWSGITVQSNNELLSDATVHYASAMPVPTVGSFKDVAVNAYYANSVLWAVENGITNGTSATAFSPDRTCTNAHVITFLWRKMGSPNVGGVNTFNDVTSADYFYGAALWAKSMGLVTGDTFAPNSPCPRATAIYYMWKAAGSPDATININFSDLPKTHPYAKAVAWAVNLGVTNGTSATTFSPDRTCTRAQIVTFLWRSVVNS